MLEKTPLNQKALNRAAILVWTRRSPMLETQLRMQQPIDLSKEPHSPCTAILV